jgi:hypothetical protein
MAHQHPRGNFMVRTAKKRSVPKRRRTGLIEAEHIAQSILILRGQRVLLDRELAGLYGVTTKRFNEQVKRNVARFPGDFMFRLSAEEAGSLRSQFATLNTARGQHSKYLPYVFTEHGAIMAAMILNSARAVEMSVYVVRAFVRLRDLLSSNKELAKRIDDLEGRIARKLSIQDDAISGIIKAIRELMNPPAPRKRPIGFIELEERKK